jgi:hypothetical protein
MVQQAKNEVGDGESPMTSAQNLRLNCAIIDYCATAIAPPNASLRRHHRTTCVKGPGEVMVTAVCVFSSQSCNVAHNLGLLLAFTLLSTFLSCAPTIIV